MKVLIEKEKREKDKMDDCQWEEASEDIDMDAADHVKMMYPRVKFPLQGKMFTIPVGSFFVFNARKFLHGGGPGKNIRPIDLTN